MLEEKLLGFDVRELWLDPDDSWDQQRRERFLLRVDAPKPLSTDTLVWPSVFDSGQAIGFSDAERERLHVAGIPLPSWIGPNAGLWSGLASMRHHLVERWARPRPHAIVAVCWFSERGFSDAGSVGQHDYPTEPAARSADWKLLGFDVADGSLVSGISNCGYDPAEAAVLRLQWSDHLNARHLFADLAPALAFRDLTDTRVLEHAPFFVYGLYLLEEISWLWIGLE